MCRNIRTLDNGEPGASDEKIQDAALQYVRKLAGIRKPSRSTSERRKSSTKSSSKIGSRCCRVLTSGLREGQGPPS
ncbi:MAG TPA: DUF2277 domain-containing protein [Myxococcales bacterium]|nr:DUF2277 domain-containing protein [Myxococcales bacterium]HIM03207.1 DUF2277 domain-containing protein [Myxococcales bacterium]